MHVNSEHDMEWKIQRFGKGTPVWRRCSSRGTLMVSPNV